MTIRARLAHMGICVKDRETSDAEIMRKTETACRRDPGFMPREAFMHSLDQRLAQ